jgi:peptidoglycan-N-acetylglucosamine deacetylase
VTPMLLRAPYGFCWVGMREVQRKLALLDVMWTVMGFDWRWTADKIVNHVLGNTAPGGIVCLHDGRGVEKNPDISQTLKAVRKIVPVLQDQGYSFEIVNDLMHV